MAHVTQHITEPTTENSANKTSVLAMTGLLIAGCSGATRHTTLTSDS